MRMGTASRPVRSCCSVPLRNGAQCPGMQLQDAVPDVVMRALELGYWCQWLLLRDRHDVYGHDCRAWAAARWMGAAAYAFGGFGACALVPLQGAAELSSRCRRSGLGV